jgi:hypothetical protein
MHSFTPGLQSRGMLLPCDLHSSACILTDMRRRGRTGGVYPENAIPDSARKISVRVNCFSENLELQVHKLTAP